MRSSGSKLLGLFAILILLFPMAAGATTSPLLPPDAEQGAFAGTSVAIFGDLAAVGAPDAQESGAVYLYQKSGDQWNLLTGEPIRQPADDQDGGDDFGKSVAISGDGTTYLLIVGAPGDDGAGQTAGAGYIFTISGNTVSSPQKLSISGPEASDRALGTSAGIYWNASSPTQSIAVMGAPLDFVPTQGNQSGSIAVFGYNGTSWTLVNSRIYPLDGDGGDRFGASVAAADGFVIAGADSAQSTNGSNGGEAYIFSQGNWSSPTKLSSGIDLSESDFFGESVSIDGDFAIVGASGYDDTALSNSGTAFVFSRDDTNGNWLLSNGNQLIPDDNASFDRFGSAVSLSGNFSVIGAPEEGTYGAAYIYENNGGSWIPFLWDHDLDDTTPDIHKKLPTSITTELTENAKFGASVAVYDNLLGSPDVLVGAPENGFLAADGGSAQIDDDANSSQPGNIAPVISDLMNVSSTEILEFSQPLQAYDFDLQPLTLTASSSNPFVVAATGVLLDGASIGGGLSRNVDDNGSLRGTLSFTPVGRGQTTITISVSDGEDSASTSFTVNITNPPEILDASGLDIVNQTTSHSSDEDADGSISFQVADGDGDTLSIDATSDNEALIPPSSLQVGGAPLSTDVTTTPGTNKPLLLSYSPASNASGAATITMTVSDGSKTVETFFEVTIDEVNDPPSFTGLGTETVDEDSGLSTTSFTVEDIDSPASDISVTLESSDNPALLPLSSLALDGSGSNWSLSFTPMVDMSGSAQITLEASDGANSGTGTLTINVTEDGVVLENFPSDFEVLEDNTGETGFTLRHTRSLSTTVTVSSNNGILLPNSDTNIKLNGTTRELTVSSFVNNQTDLNLLLDPEPNQSGVADISVTATDVDGNSDTKSFTFTVTDVNDPPVLTGVPTTLQTIDEDTSFGPITISVSDPDDPLSALTITALSSVDGLVPDGIDPVGPESRIEITGTENNRNLKITPLPNQNSDIQGGTTLITITLSDGSLEDSTSFELQVDPVNDAPVFTPSPLPSVTDFVEDDPLRTLSYSVQDVDQEGITLTAASTNETLFDSVHFGPDATGPNPLLLPASPDPIPFDLTLDLAADQFGTSYITVTATDGAGDNPTQFFVDVESVNDVPVVTGEAPSQGAPGQSYSFTVEVSDVETPVEELVVSVLNKPSWAQFDQSTLTFSGTPANGDEGTYNVTIVATDADNESGSKDFSFSIVREEFAPEINAPQGTEQTVLENETVSIPFEVGDANADTLLVTATIQNTDPALLSDAGVEVPGLAADNTIEVGFDSPTALSLEITPEQYANSVKYGTAEILVTVDDQIAATPNATATFTITVGPVDTPPVVQWDKPDPEIDVGLNNQSFTTDEDAPLAIPISIVERDWGTLSISASSQSTNVIPEANIDIGLRGQSAGFGPNYSLAVNSDDPQLLEIVLEPAEFASGTASIDLALDLTGRDGSTRTSALRFVVSVNPVNDPPVITADTTPWSMEEGTTKAFSFGVSDPEGNDLLMTIGTSDADPDVEILPATESHIRINGVGYPAGGFPLTETVYGNPIQIELTPTAFANTSGIDPVQITIEIAETDTDPALSADPKTISLEITPVNDPPSLEAISSQAIDEDTPENDETAAIGLEVSDPDGDELEFAFESENTELVPNDQIHLYVNGARRFPPVLAASEYGSAELRIVPNPNANSELNGTAFINVTVNDPALETAARRFRLTVTPLPDMPVIDYNNGSFDINEGGQVDTNFTVSDADGDDLLVTVASDQPAVVPNNKNNLILSDAAGSNLNGDSRVQATVPTTSGQAANVNLSVIPLPDQFTTSPLTITLTASDGTLEATPATFTMSVTNINDKPVITGLFNPSSMVFGDPKIIPFSVTDADPGDLDIISINAQSDNPDLVANSNLTVRDLGSGDYELEIITNVNAVIADPFSSANITVLANDQKEATTETFELQVFPDTTQVPEIALNFDDTVAQLVKEDEAKELSIEILFEGAGGFDLFGASSSEELVPGGNISFEAQPQTEPNVFPYLVKLTPAKDAFSTNIDNDTAAITLFADANGFIARADFEVAVLPKNDPPVITPLFDPVADTSTFANAPKTLDFLVSDVETAANDLTVEVAYIPLTGTIASTTLECTDGNCRLTLTPIGTTSAERTAQVTLSVDDGSGVDPVLNPEEASVTETSFTFNVLPNDNPAIGIPNDFYQTPDGTPIVVEFTVNDPNGGPLDLVFSANPVAPIQNIFVADGESNLILSSLDVPGTVTFPEGETSDTLFLTIEPVPGALSDTRITGTVRDTSLAQAQDAFDLRIFTPGDIDADGDADLADVISGLQILVGLQPPSVDLRADINGDNRIGLPDVIHDLQVVAEIR
jgi:hypothetical protein